MSDRIYSYLLYCIGRKVRGGGGGATFSCMPCVIKRSLKLHSQKASDLLEAFPTVQLKCAVTLKNWDGGDQ